MATNLDHLIAWTSPNLCVHPIPSHPILSHSTAGGGGYRVLFYPIVCQRTFPTSIKMLKVSEGIIMSCRCSPGTCIYLPLTRADADSGIAVLRSVGGGSRDLDLPPGHRVSPPRARKRVVLGSSLTTICRCRSFLSTCTRALGLVFQWNEIEISENKPKLHFLTGTGQRR